MLQYEMTTEDGMLLVMLDGRLDTDSAPAFEEAVLESLSGIRTVTLDMNGVDYVSSAGLRVLLKLQKQMKGALRVVHVSEPIMDILEVTGFSDLLTIE